MIIQPAYDALITQVVTSLAMHQELDDNVVIENNSELKLKLGFAIEWGAADNTEKTLDCNESIKQTVYITNTIAVRGTLLDKTARKTAEKALLENCYTLAVAIGKNPQLDNTCDHCKFSGHNGIEPLFDDNNKVFIMTRSTYTIEVIKNS